MTEDEKNNAALKELIEKIKGHEVLLFVGAGASKRAGYPLWQELICALREKMQREANEDLSKFDTEISDLLWQAYRVVKQYDPGYKIALREIFSLKDIPVTPFHHRLMELPFHRYVTVNYDDLLERAARQARNNNEFAYTLSWHEELSDYIRNFRRDKEEYVFHLHGSKFDIHNSKEELKIILTEGDYVRFYGEQNPIRELLWMMIATYSILFIGFGMSDWDFLLLFRLIRNRMVLHKPYHYAIIPYQDRDGHKETLRIYLNQKYGIEPIFYTVVPRKLKSGITVPCFETELDNLMNKISQECSGLAPYEHHFMPDEMFHGVQSPNPQLQKDADLLLGQMKQKHKKGQL